MANNEPIADAADGVAQPTERPLGKTKVMVYIPHALHRAVKLRAVDEGRSASELFTDAVRGYLSLPDEFAEAVCPSAAKLDVRSDTVLMRLAESVERQGRMIEDIKSKLGRRQETPDHTDTSRTVGTRTADAMQSILALLRRSGDRGADIKELNDAVWSAGIKSGAAEAAKTVLRGAGLVRYEGRRWYLADR